ncbi:MAG: serine hydrolase [Clostridiaceae bacterium]|nr:serine hydrolase [Clostridiaceae bacterium]
MHRINLEGFVQNIIQQKLVVYHVNVRQHGEVIGTLDWRDNRRDNIHSCSKVIVSLGVGIAVDEGLLSLDDKPAEIFPEKLPKNPSPYLLDIRVRDMIKMATGHDYFILQGYDKTGKAPGRNDLNTDDWIEYAFKFDVPYKPGTHWKYNNFGPFLASAMIQQRSGQRLVDYLKSRLFLPLGIRNPQWEETPMGRTLGCGGLCLNADEMGRIGEVCLDGTYQGKQIVSRAYVNEATSNLIDNSMGATGPIDSTAGYGYFFWRCARDNAYSGHGWGGQFIIVLPEQDAVVTLTAHDFEGQKMFDAVWDYIVPQLKESI